MFNNQESELLWSHGTYLTLLYMIISVLHYLVRVKGTYISTISDLVIVIMNYGRAESAIRAQENSRYVRGARCSATKHTYIQCLSGKSGIGAHLKGS